MSNPLHKRKLRLALEDVRQPDSVTYPCLSKLDHYWVVNEWLPSIGLNQYKVRPYLKLFYPLTQQTLESETGDKSPSVIYTGHCGSGAPKQPLSLPVKSHQLAVVRLDCCLKLKWPVGERS